MAAESWELKTARLEGAYEQIGQRLGAVESRLSTLEQKVDAGFAEVRNEMRRQFYWLLGVMGGLLAVMISGFLQLALSRH